MSTDAELRPKVLGWVLVGVLALLPPASMIGTISYFTGTLKTQIEALSKDVQGVRDQLRDVNSDLSSLRSSAIATSAQSLANGRELDKLGDRISVLEIRVNQQDKILARNGLDRK